MLPVLKLKKNEERRLRAGHLWIYSNEIDTKATPLKAFSPGQEVRVEAYDKTILGHAYVNPHSLITARLYTRKLKERLNPEFFIAKLQKALTLRSALYSKPYYRLIFGESDELPGLIIDRYDTTIVVQQNTAGMDVLKAVIIESLCAALPETQHILFRNDSSSRRQEGLPEEIISGFGTPPEEVLVEENDAAFYAPIWKGQKTGWFYDHRLNRSRLTNYVKNQRVLDVFSYLGAWGIQAAQVGAREVTCIDSSALASSYIQKNADLNHLNNISVITGDAFDTLKELQQQERFEVIILDPPAFAKKQKDLKEATLAYQRLNELAFKLLQPNGILIACSCSMQISYEIFLQTIRRASIQNRSEFQILERGHQAPDHPVHTAIPETDYLKMILGRKT